MHAFGNRQGNESEQAEKGELDEIDESQQRCAQRPRLHHVREQLDSDVRIAPCHHRATNEHDPHQAVACDLLCPGKAVVEYVAREELQKDDEGERPEDHESKPILRVVLDHDLDVFRLNEAFLAFGRFLLFFAHDPRAVKPVMLARKRIVTGLRVVLFQRLQGVVLGLRPAGTRTRVVV